MKKALPSKPGSPAHTEVTTLKESIVALQAEVTENKDKIAVQDTERAELDEKINLQDEQLNELTSESKKQAANVQALRAELQAVKTRNAALVAGRITVESKNLALEAKIGKLQAETDTLKAFKQTHIREAQPMLVSLMTMENQVDGMDEDDARRAAELRYVDMFDVPIAESDDGE
jgi:chromosome segregation ATPase